MQTITAVKKSSRLLKSIYRYEDYRRYLKDQIVSNGRHHGYKGRLAKAAGCHGSFLSQVLAGQAQLSPEHALGVARLWGLSRAEQEYFLLLVSLARAGTAELEAHYRALLERCRGEEGNLARRFEQKTLTEQWQVRYYSSWHYAAVHMALTIPGCRTPEAMATKLQITPQLVTQVLGELLQMGLVSEKGGRWHTTEKSIHLPRESLLNRFNHALWRHRALEAVAQEQPDNIHYSSLCTLSKDDYERLRQTILQFLDESRRMILQSPEEELVSFSLDFFRL